MTAIEQPEGGARMWFYIFIGQTKQLQSALSNHKAESHASYPLPLPFSLYLRRGFCSESDDVKGNRAKHDLIERIHTYLAHIYIIIHANQSVRSDLVRQ